MPGALAVYREFQRRLAAGEVAALGDVVDLEGYTENCLGLTGWTTGFGVALANFGKNMLAPFADRRTTEEEVVECGDVVVIRGRIEATHTGEFLGVAPTGRRVAWDYLVIAHVEGGRLVGQWVQPDLWGLHQQLTVAAPEPPARTKADASRTTASAATQDCSSCCERK